MSAAIHHLSPVSDRRLQLPSELTDLRNWLVWRFVQKPGDKKPRKVPFYIDGTPRRGDQGSETDRASMATFADAVETCARGRYNGLGFAIFPDSNLVALDFDNCVKDGVVDPAVAELVLGTYAEYSPSGNGLRAFMRGSLRSHKDNASEADRNVDGSRKDGLFDIEVFGDNGFVTITGNVTEDCELLGLQDTVCEITHEVWEVYRRRFRSDGAITIYGADDGDLPSAPVAPLGWTLDEARTILFACDASAPREQWLRALMAIHHELGGTPEALDLCDEWSSTGSSYSGRSDVEGRWHSFGRSRNNAVTGRWLLSWRSECQAHEKYEAVSEFKSQIAAASDEFRLCEVVCKDIREDVRLDEMGREALAQALLSAFSKLGSKYPIGQCRKLVAEKRPERMREKRDTPEWLEDWVYVSDDDKFFRLDSDEWLTMQGFNARFNREVVSDEDGAISKSAAWVALEDFAIPTVTRATYLPWADRLFELDGISHVNTYRLSSVPEAVVRLSADGCAAVDVVKRHIDLLVGGRTDLAKTLIDWMAHNVQSPGVKIRWAPLIKGVEGDGKSVLGSLMAGVMGRSNVRNVSPKVLGTDFTAWASGSCVSVLEEIKLTGHNRYDILNALKPFLTNDSVEIHAKGKDPYDAINTTNYMAFTNHNDALPLSDTDRRWLIIFSPFSSSSEMAARVRSQGWAAGSDSDVLGFYFDALHDAINLHRAELRRWLLDWKISESFKPNGSAPITDEKGLMIGMSCAEEELSIRELLEKGGTGISVEIFASSYLYSEFLRSETDISLATTSWNHWLKRLGYTRLPKKVKWRGRAESVWVRGARNLEPFQIRAELDKTVVEDAPGSESDDLF